MLQARLQLLHNHLAVQPARCVSTETSTHPRISGVDVGSKYSSSYRRYATDATGKILSYFHDIPLAYDRATRTANMVVEVPRWLNAKFEINKELEGNPIVQDEKKGAVRFVRNLFPYHGYIHNYGAFPQTWENNSVQQEGTGLYGDNDPLDVCEIGASVLELGSVKRVKILGALALIDDGELDWKVIVVDVQDELAAQVSSVADLDKVCPGLLAGTRQWFRDYKLADLKPPNAFAFEGRYLLADETLDVVEECHAAWTQLIEGKVKSKGGELSLKNVSQKTSPHHLDLFTTVLGPGLPDTAIPGEISRSHFFEFKQ